jgi:hypothetical protein
MLAKVTLGTSLLMCDLPICKYRNNLYGISDETAFIFSGDVNSGQADDLNDEGDLEGKNHSQNCYVFSMYFT